MRTDNGYPYNFDLEKIDEMVTRHLTENRPQKALDELFIIKDSYLQNREKIDYNTLENEHLMGYLMESVTLDSEDPTKVADYFYFELSKTIEAVKATTPIQIVNAKWESIQKSGSELTTAEKGIVLFFLMYSGSGKFTATRKPEILNDHLKKLGLDGSGKTVYNKGICHLITDSDRDDERKIGKTRKHGVFTHQQFLNAIKFLKNQDNKAFETAQNEYNYYCGEEVNRGNNTSFFKNN